MSSTARALVSQHANPTDCSCFAQTPRSQGDALPPLIYHPGKRHAEHKLRCMLQRGTRCLKEGNVCSQDFPLQTLNHAVVKAGQSDE